MQKILYKNQNHVQDAGKCLQMANSVLTASMRWRYKHYGGNLKMENTNKDHYGKIIESLKERKKLVQECINKDMDEMNDINKAIERLEDGGEKDGKKV